VTGEAAVAAPFYVAGGTLPPDTPSYVTRRADDEIHDCLRAGELCYVLTARQTGKSSLIVRALTRLKASGVATAMVDLTRLGKERGRTGSDEWYFGLAYEIHRQLGIGLPLRPWWEQHRSLPALLGLDAFLRELVLGSYPGHVVIVIDEIDSTIGLPFADDFFAAIRGCYNARAIEPAYERLTFALLGVASPDQLIRDPSRTPFNVGRRIELADFTAKEAAVLALGLSRQPDTAAVLLERVLYWTGGQPYLTQAVCRAIAEHGEDAAAAVPDVDRVVEDLFLTARSQREESNLKHARARLTVSGPAARRPLQVYLRVRSGEAVADEPTSPSFVQLKLSGLVRVCDAGRLVVRNRIYERVFTEEWARSHLPTGRRWQFATATAVILCLVGFFLWGRRQETTSLAQRDATRKAVALNLAASTDLVNVGKVVEARRLLLQALALAKRSGDTRSQAVALGKLGGVDSMLGNDRSALLFHSQALPLYRRLGDRRGTVGALLAVGSASNKLMDPGRARTSFSEALDTATELKDLWLQIAARLGLAQAFAAQGHLLEALDMARSCRPLLLASLQGAEAAPRERVILARGLRQTSDLEIELLMTMHRAEPSAGYDRQAWLVSERDRAPALLHAVLGDERPSDSATAARKGLIAALNQATAAKLQLEQQVAPEDLGQMAGLAKQIDKLAGEYEAWSTGWTPPTGAWPFSAEDLQSALDRDSVLLEFHLGERHSYLWAVTLDDLQAFDLPAASKIERLSEGVSRGDTLGLAADLLALGRQLLGQASHQLARPRLLIVSEGSLAHLPFGAFPDLLREGDPLILRHEVVVVPSLAWVLAARRSHRQRMTHGSIAVVGDPVMSLADHRAHGLRGPAGRWDRLPMLGFEVAELSSLIGRDRRSLIATGFTASRELIMGGRLRPFAILHFATYALLDRQHPELSSLALSLVDPTGRRRDGLVRAYEVPNLDLSARLVVLSGGDTAVGEDKGEGDTMGLSEHFLAQGVSQVIGSLWAVEDRSTAELMARFYRHLLIERQPAATALAMAQRELWLTSQWRSPRYWSGFILQGMP